MDPKNFVYLSDNGEDSYINMLAEAVGGNVTATEQFNYADNDQPIVLRSILKYKIMEQCRLDQRDFYYIDSGYLGNNVHGRNRRGRKFWHRVVKNNLQHNTLITRPDDRFNRVGIQLPKTQRHGSKILIAAPDEKPCRAYGIELESWINDTIATLKQYTDREIVVRYRNKSRQDRTVHNTLVDALTDDVHALVTFNSNAATESVLHGVPAFALAPTHAAHPVTSTDLSTINNPFWPNQDLLYKWVCHLTYCQFHVNELKRGKFWNVVNENSV
jgi:hypothetical protein